LQNLMLDLLGQSTPTTLLMGQKTKVLEQFFTAQGSIVID